MSAVTFQVPSVIRRYDASGSYLPYIILGSLTASSECSWIGCHRHPTNSWGKNWESPPNGATSSLVGTETTENPCVPEKHLAPIETRKGDPEEVYHTVSQTSCKANPPYGSPFPTNLKIFERIERLAIFLVRHVANMARSS